MKIINIYKQYFMNDLPRKDSEMLFTIEFYGPDGVPGAVSYTHLDVYKRQQ